MSEKVAWSVLEALRGAPRGPQIGVIALQLFAWAKLSQDDLVSSDISFNRAGAASSPTLYMRECFSSLDGDPNFALAFSALDEQQDYPEVIDDAIRVISSAYKAGKIDYVEVASPILGAMAVRHQPHVEPFFAHLMAELSGVIDSDRVYCPFDNTYAIASAVAKVSRHVVTEVNSRPSPIPSLLNILEGKHIDPVFSDPIFSPGCTSGDGLERFDVTIAFPPIGLRIDPKKLDDWYGRFPFRSAFGELYAIQHVMAQTSRKAVVCVSNGLLFRSAQTERHFRQKLVEEGYLEAVIALPKDIFRSSSSIACSLLVLDCQRNSPDVLFIDASKKLRISEINLRGASKRTFASDDVLRLVDARNNTDESAIVSSSELEKNDFNLVADRYILSDKQRGLMAQLEQYEIKPLDEIATLIRPQSLRKIKSGEGEVFYEVWPSDAPDGGYLEEPDREIALSKGQIEKARRQAIQASDLLLSVKGTIGSIALAAPNFQGRWLPSQSQLIVRLKTNSEIDPRALYMYFRSELFQTLLGGLATGATIQMVQMADIRKLPIPILPLQEQERVIEAFDDLASYDIAIKKLQNESSAARKRYWSLSGNIANLGER